MPIWDKWLRRNDKVLPAHVKLEGDFKRLYEQRKYREARDIAKRTLEFVEGNGALQGPSVARWHHNLGLAYEAMGNYEVSAILACQHALDMYRQYPGQHDAALATTLMSLGNVSSG